MADIDIKRTHDLGLAAAREAADRMVEDLSEKFGLSGGWTGNTHHFDRPGVTGSLHLTDKDLHLTVKLGFLLKMMRGPLEAAIVRELDSLFERHAGRHGGKPARGHHEPARSARKPAIPKSGSSGRKKAG